MLVIFRETGRATKILDDRQPRFLARPYFEIFQS